MSSSHAYGYPTPGYAYDIRLRKVLKDLRRAELVAAKEHDRIRKAARDAAGDGTSVQTDAAHLGHPRPKAERRRQAQARE